MILTSHDFNNFIDSTKKHGAQAEDLGTDNRWNTSNLGNYWSEWTQPDENGDGIVDIPYVVVGITRAKDFFERAKDIFIELGAMELLKKTEHELKDLNGMNANKDH